MMHGIEHFRETNFFYTIGIASTLTVPTFGFIHSIFIMSLLIWFIVESMKINWTGNESVHHENKMKHFSGEQSYKRDINMNTISNIDILDSLHTK